MKDAIRQAEEEIPNRVEPRCRHFGPCGGCSLQHLDYAAQVEWRRAGVASLLERELGGVRIPPVEAVPMPEPWNHRSKMEFTFGREGEGISLGLHLRGSFHRIVDIERCEIAHPRVGPLLEAVKESAVRSGLPSYDVKRHAGFWRFAVVRAGRSGQLMLLLVTNDGPREPVEAMAAELPRRVPELRSFHWGVSAKVSDVARPDRSELLFGEGTLEDAIGPVRYRFGPANFLQPNQALVEPVHRAIRESAGLTGAETVYDLYCGIGLISLTLAGGAERVRGVESEPESVDLAEKNAALNGIANAEFLCARVEDVLRKGALFRSGPAPDVVVLDPPRAGLHGDVIAPLLEAQPSRLIYLSCNPASLARDLKLLLGRDPGYQIRSARMFDFFPHTVHAEVLVTLAR